jgi:Na+-transporting methylmalonyl-CoA/oxaloacetate decarboxylase gamma subunit
MHLTATTLRLAAFASADQVARAVEITVIGMLMVFAALALLTVFLTLLPRFLGWINAVWPERGDRHATLDAAAELLGDEDDVLAAIGFVLHVESREQP